MTLTLQSRVILDDLMRNGRGAYRREWASVVELLAAGLIHDIAGKTARYYEFGLFAITPRGVEFLKENK